MSQPDTPEPDEAPSLTIPDWIVLLVGRQTLELEAARRQINDLHQALPPPDPSSE